VYDNDRHSPTFATSIAQYAYQLEEQAAIAKRITDAGGTVALGAAGCCVPSCCAGGAAGAVCAWMSATKNPRASAKPSNSTMSLTSRMFFIDPSWFLREFIDARSASNRIASRKEQRACHGAAFTPNQTFAAMASSATR
jgi:hypothetical protein